VVRHTHTMSINVIREKNSTVNIIGGVVMKDIEIDEYIAEDSDITELEEKQLEKALYEIGIHNITKRDAERLNKDICKIDSSVQSLIEEAIS